jgi:hypothetical protein
MEIKFKSWSKHTKKEKMTLLVMISVLMLYFCVYVIFSALGSYSNFPSSSGRLKYDFGLGIRDQIEWNPRFMDLRQNGFNGVGLFYSPLILLDRKFWHQPKNIFSDGV